MHAAFCEALAHPARLRILDLLRDCERSVGEIAQLLDMRLSNVSQHLSLLRDRDLLRSRRTGTRVLYSIAHPEILAALDLISQVLAKVAGERQQ